MRLRWLVVGLLTLLSLTLPAQAQDSVVLEIVNRVNQARTQAGIPPLALNDSLTKAAQRHSTDMATTGKLQHSGSDGSEFWQRMQDAGYALTTGAQNILARLDADPAAVFDEWNGSPAHRANMMNAGYIEIGVAYTKSSSGLYYFTMLLATRSDATPLPVLPTLTATIVPTSAGILPSFTPSPTNTLVPASSTPVPTNTPVPTTAVPATPASNLFATNTPDAPVATQVSPGYAEISQAVRDSMYYFSHALAPELMLTPAMTASPTLTLAPVVVATDTPQPLFTPTIAATSIPPEQADVKLVYNGESFAVINVSGRRLDLKPLRFESSSGTLEAAQWQTQYLTEPLEAFTPGDCLQVWSLATKPVLDKPAACGIRHSWIVVNDSMLFWKNTDTFTVRYAGDAIATCATNVIECNISLASMVNVLPPTRATPFTLSGADIRLTIADLGVSLLNVSGRELDVSGLVFESTSGTFTAQSWNIPQLSRPLTAFPPGDCLQVWGLYTNYLNPPENCHTRHAWVSVGEQGQFWLNADTFTVKQGDVPITTCTISAGTCDIDLPNQ